MCHEILENNKCQLSTRFEQPQIDVVDSDTQAIQNLKKVASSCFFKPLPESAKVKSEVNEDSVKEADILEQPALKKVRGPASKTIKPAAVKRKVEAEVAVKRKEAEVEVKRKEVAKQPIENVSIADPEAKKVRTEVERSFFVEKVHVCKICHGKDQNGKIDKEALNLSFRYIASMLHVSALKPLIHVNDLQSPPLARKS